MWGKEAISGYVYQAVKNVILKSRNALGDLSDEITLSAWP